MLKYWIWLATRSHVSRAEAKALVRQFPSIEELYLAGESTYRPLVKDPDSLLDKNLGEAEAILARCRSLDISLLTMQDAAYPRRLQTLEDAPVLLYYRGRLPDLSGPAVAVVGTRKASAYGLTQARRLSFGLSRCGCMVVTGGAAGIDTEAVKGALTGGSPVLVVLGCGVDVVYPRSNRRLFQDVIAHGCLMSEYPPGTEALSWHFPVRNRLISGLSLGVLVAEAPEKSGALITAGLALDQGRDVFTLPANVGSATSGGNLKLLREGAIPVGTAWDLLQEYEQRFGDRLTRPVEPEPEFFPEMPPEREEQPVKSDPESKKVVDKPEDRAYIDLKDVIDTVGPAEQTLLRLLEGGPMHIDVLAAQAQMGLGQALASLTLLEVRGLIQRPGPRLYQLQLAGK